MREKTPNPQNFSINLGTSGSEFVVTDWAGNLQDRSADCHFQTDYPRW